MIIEKGKEYQTKNGYEVRIYALDGSKPFPVHGAYKVNEEWKLASWSINGKELDKSESVYDLVEKTTEIEVWINVFADTNICAYRTKELADHVASVVGTKNFLGQENVKIRIPTSSLGKFQ
jgi:hypothetical protein